MDRAPGCNCQLLDRLCHWIANVTVWPHSGKSVLRLCIRVQHPYLAQEASDTTPASGRANIGNSVTDCPRMSSTTEYVAARQMSKNILATTICSRTRTEGSFPSRHADLHHRRTRTVCPNIQRYVMESSRPGVLLSRRVISSTAGHQHLGITGDSLEDASVS